MAAGKTAGAARMRWPEDRKSKCEGQPRWGFDSPALHEEENEMNNIKTVNIMEKYIHTQKADREFLMKAFGVTAKTVFNALHFDEQRGHTDLAKKIRKIAMDRGGIVMTVSPEVETLHDSDGYMRQYLPNGVLLEFSKMDDAGCDVFHNGELVRHYDRVMVSDILGIQNWAATLR